MAEMNDSCFGVLTVWEGIFAEQINRMFHVACRTARLEDGPKLSTWACEGRE